MELSELAERDILASKSVVLGELQETIHNTAWSLCIDPGPRMFDKLAILNAITDPDYHRDPLKLATVLETMMQFNQGSRTYTQYMQPVASALLRYAVATRKVSAKSLEQPKTEAASFGGDERF